MLRPTVVAAALALVAAALAAAACGGGGGAADAPADDQPAGGGPTRTAEAAGVTVEGTWLMPADLPDLDADLGAYPLDEYVLVEIDFTTHSGDLNAMEMEQAAGLKRADEAAAPVAWLSLSDDSHHRAGILVFERTVAEGPAELTLDMGGEEVALLWESVPAG